MRFIICEIGSSYHIHCVAAMAKIIGSEAENKIDVLVNAGQAENLSDLNKYANIKIYEVGSIEDKIRSVDEFYKKYTGEKVNWIFPTLEPISKHNIQLYSFLRHTLKNAKVFVGVHNVNLWFGRNKLFEIIGILAGYKKNHHRFYLAKIRLWAFFSSRMKNLIATSGGAFITVSNNVANELKRRNRQAKTIVIPSDIFDRSLISMIKPEIEDSDKLKLVIPGFISNVRRDYSGLLDAFEKYLPEIYKNKIRIDLAGTVDTGDKDGVKIIQKAIQMNSKGFHIKLFGDKFIPMHEFNQALMNADLIGAIISKPGKFQTYGKTKESGAPYTMIKMAKPGIVPQDYSVTNELLTSLISYRDLADFVLKIIELIDYPEKLSTLKENALINSEFFSPENLWERIKQEFN